jgi:eukaryotic-like serine/threonine-protein kinase
MSPEQLEGKEADARSDIFSLGAVLYEMVTGKRAFEGKTAASMMAAILAAEPKPISAVQPMLPSALDHLIRACLAKDPDERIQSVHDVELQLKWIAGAGSEMGVAAPVAARSRMRERLAWGAAALELVAVAFAIGFVLRTPKPTQAMRLSVDLGTEAKLYSQGLVSVLSPDGIRLAFLALASDQKRHIYVRSLNQLQASALSGTENAENPFFSPDSEWLGFFADGKLKKVSVQGSAAVAVCDAANGRGASWSEDGTIVFAPDLRAALLRVPAVGGTPLPLTKFDQQAGEVTQRWPQFLPGGKAVLFTSNTHGGNYEDAERFKPPRSDGSAGAAPRRYCRGSWRCQCAVFSRSGRNPHVCPGSQRIQVRLDLLVGPPGQIYSDPRNSRRLLHACVLSRRKASRAGDQRWKKSDIWVYDLARDTLTRLTFSGNNLSPIWTPDGQRITYVDFEKAGVGDLYWTRADGTGSPLRLTETSNRKFPSSWHPSGKVLAFDQNTSGNNYGTSIVAIEGNDKQGWKPGESKPLLTGPFAGWESSFSPDGRWLAYDSNETGDYEIYVRPFPGPGGKWQISTGGGRYPKWSRTTKELFYRTPDSKIMVTSYAVSGESFSPGKPQLWSSGQFTERSGSVNFDLHPDGKRFAVLKTRADSETSPNKVNFIFNFFDEVRGKAQSQK